MCAMEGNFNEVTLSTIYKHSKLYTVKCLHQTECADIPAENGVNFVLVPDGFEVRFSNCTTAIPEYDGRSLLYDADELAKKFEEGDKKILYIGKASWASNGLPQRIQQLVRYGHRRVKNHRGGRALWQIANPYDLLIGCLPCEQAAQVEKNLLREYCNTYRTLPVANWVPKCKTNGQLTLPPASHT